MKYRDIQKSALYSNILTHFNLLSCLYIHITSVLIAIDMDIEAAAELISPFDATWFSHAGKPSQSVVKAMH